MKKVLFITFLYPPIINSGTQRSQKFSYYLPDFGWEPIVLTFAPPYGGMPTNEELNKEVRKGTRIIRVPLKSELVARKLAQYYSKFPTSRSPREIVDGLEWRIRKLMCVPDQWAAWIPTAVQKGLEIFENEKFDLIYASGFPWSSFVVAHKISKKTNVPYIIDFRDLWASEIAEFNTTPWLVNLYSHLLEKRIIKHAKTVITTTNSFAEFFKNSPSPVHVITNGYDKNDFLDKGDTDDSLFDYIKSFVSIAYTGVWKPGYSPEELYNAIYLLRATKNEIVQRIRVITAGYPSRLEDNDIKNYVKELGVVSHAEAVRITRKATALFLPVSQGPYSLSSLPGKLFDYLGSGTSIIASIPEGSESFEVLSQIGGSIIIPPGDVKQLASQLEYLVVHGKLNCPPINQKELAKYERKKLTEKLAQVFNRVAIT